jgi:signal transduction histidine kinase/ActR/RegA family two-component response regulator
VIDDRLANASIVAGARWSAANASLVWLWVVVCAVALWVIWTRRAFDDVLYLWLAMVVVAAMVDLSLGNVTGRRYTLAWHASRASLVVSSYLLLGFLVGDLTQRRHPTLILRLGAYGGAIAAILGAVFLRWFLDPWLGATVPYITLYGAVAIAVWLGGWGPAVLATTLGYGIVNTLYVAPGRLAVGGPPEILQLVLFVVSCALIIGLGESLRRTRDRHRLAEAQAQERAAALQRADASKSQFLAMLSHELRNPLAPLRTGLAILRMKPDSPERTRIEDAMERQVVQLTRLVDDLLDISRIDRGHFEVQLERVSLDDVVNAALEMARPNIDARFHRLMVHRPEVPVYIDGDSVRLTQAIANLLNNAAKFTPPRGHIELTTHAEGSWAVLRVRDTGVGLAPEHLRTVFDMFVQVDPKGLSATGGLGLGLTLVRSIVQRHGGQVEARSAGPGQGAEFVITLPLADTPAAVAGPAPISRATTPRRVLIVDDNVDAAQSVTDFLRLAGHHVEGAHDGRAALVKADALRPEVALIDLDMPGMDGIELATRLRTVSEARGDTVVLIALTGLGQEADVARTQQAGFAEHLTKPADPERLLAILARPAS